MKMNKWIYAAALGLLFASCESVETPMFSDKKDAFVAFDSKEITFAENGGDIRIPVTLVATQAYDVTLSFEIDTTAYAGKNAAKEGVHYNLKSTEKTVTFVAGGELTQYIELEAIDNTTFDGDVFFDVKLSVVSGSLNLGANYTTKVTLGDDDHPLKIAGILGTYNGSGTSQFSNDQGTVYTWTCEITSDPDDVNGVWISQLAADLSGATFTPIFGKVSADKTSISIEKGQSVGTYGSYGLQIDFNGAQSVTASRSGSDFTISGMVLYAAYSGETLAGYISALSPVTLTKVEE